MKIIVSANGKTLDSSVDMRFGRCQYFIVVETDRTGITKADAVENQGNAEGHGAGIRAAEQAGELGADAIITGNLGPKATDVLDRMGIKTYHGSGKVEDAVLQLLDNKLARITEVAEPHSGTVKESSAERVYFPLLDDNGLDSEISGHFGHAPFFGLYDFSTKRLTITDNTLDHTNPAKSPIDQIVEAVNPTMIFAKGIGGRAIGFIREKGLKLKTGNFRTVREALDNLDSLSDDVQGCGHEH